MRQIDADVAVIGAGLSGLVAADALRVNGARVAVIEAQGRAGGRIAAFAGDDLLSRLDAGAQFVLPTQTAILELLDRFGLVTEDAPHAGRIVQHVAGVRVEIDPVQAPPDPAVAGQVEAALARVEEMAASYEDGLPWTAPDAKVWDLMTLRSWTLEHVTDPVARAIVEQRLTDSLGGNPGHHSLLSIVDAMKSFGSPGLPPQLLTVPTGLHSLIDALAAQLGDDLVLGSPVRSIRHGKRIEIDGDRAHITAGAAVLALSPALAGRIRFEPRLPAARRLLGQGWAEVPWIKAVLHYARPFWREQGLAGIATGDRPGASVVLDHTSPTRGGGTLVAFYIVNDEADWRYVDDAEARAAARLRSLADYFGAEATTPLAVAERDWTTDEWSLGAQSALPPGVWTQLGPQLRPPIGRLVWAGTDTATRFQGSVEGAVLAGRRAAREALAALAD